MAQVQTTSRALRSIGSNVAEQAQPDAETIAEWLLSDFTLYTTVNSIVRDNRKVLAEKLEQQIAELKGDLRTLNKIPAERKPRDNGAEVSGQMVLDVLKTVKGSKYLGEGEIAEALNKLEEKRPEAERRVFKAGGVGLALKELKSREPCPYEREVGQGRKPVRLVQK